MTDEIEQPDQEIEQEKRARKRRQMLWVALFFSVALTLPAAVLIFVYWLL